jgi:hypothetical protein
MANVTGHEPCDHSFLLEQKGTTPASSVSELKIIFFFLRMRPFTLPRKEKGAKKSS